MHKVNLKLEGNFHPKVTQLSGGTQKKTKIRSPICKVLKTCFLVSQICIMKLKLNNLNKFKYIQAGDNFEKT